MSVPDLQPTLVGDTIIIRPMANEDWPEIFSAASDPAIWELHPVRDRYREPVFKAFFEGAIASGTAFVILNAATGAVIGSSRYHGYDAELSEVEIGWTFITREYWGGPTNREIKQLMLAHAFTFVETVVFWIGEENWRSLRAMEKIGGVRREGLQLRTLSGRTSRSVVFEIRKNC